MSDRELTPQQLNLLQQCRAAIEGFDRQHADAVSMIVEHARARTGVDIGHKPPAAEPFSPWWDWSPQRFLAFVDALCRAAEVLGADRFADRRDEFTLRDLVELTREIDLASGMNAMGIFAEADRLVKAGPTS